VRGYVFVLVGVSVVAVVGGGGGRSGMGVSGTVVLSLLVQQWPRNVGVFRGVGGRAAVSAPSKALQHNTWQEVQRASTGGNQPRLQQELK
jgi:hypothetical protein